MLVNVSIVSHAGNIICLLACKTVDGDKCIFPFEIGSNVSYSKCIDTGNDNKHACATEVKDKNIATKMGICNEFCQNEGNDNEKVLQAFHKINHMEK